MLKRCFILSLFLLSGSASANSNDFNYPAYATRLIEPAKPAGEVTEDDVQEAIISNDNRTFAENRWPYNLGVRIENKNGEMCSGAIVGHGRVVVTSGHCVDPGGMTVVTESNFNGRQSPGRRFPVTRWYRGSASGVQDWAILILGDDPGLGHFGFQYYHVPKRGEAHTFPWIKFWTVGYGLNERQELDKMARFRRGEISYTGLKWYPYMISTDDIEGGDSGSVAIENDSYAIAVAKGGEGYNGCWYNNVTCTNYYVSADFYHPTLLRAIEQAKCGEYNSGGYPPQCHVP